MRNILLVGLSMSEYLLGLGTYNGFVIYRTLIGEFTIRADETNYDYGSICSTLILMLNNLKPDSLPKYEIIREMERLINQGLEEKVTVYMK